MWGVRWGLSSPIEQCSALAGRGRIRHDSTLTLPGGGARNCGKPQGLRVLPEDRESLLSGRTAVAEVGADPGARANAQLGERVAQVDSTVLTVTMRCGVISLLVIPTPASRATSRSADVSPDVKDRRAPTRASSARAWSAHPDEPIAEKAVAGSVQGF